MITINIRALARRTITKMWPNGIDSAYKLHLQCGGTPTISPSVIQQIWNSDQEAKGYVQMKKIGFATLDLVCRSLSTDPLRLVQISDWIQVLPNKPTRLERKNGRKKVQAKKTPLRKTGAKSKLKKR
ncbi:MAG: hypothetical protein MOB07_31155 [Acidobacteria bacterium]|nr:hypothetical protein [Acidobacteriota bacterium]